MSTADPIYEKAKVLPGTLQTEVLRYVDFLLSRGGLLLLHERG